MIGAAAAPDGWSICPAPPPRGRIQTGQESRSAIAFAHVRDVIFAESVENGLIASDTSQNGGMGERSIDGLRGTTAIEPSSSCPRTDECRFHHAMIGICETAKREIGYTTTRFLRTLRRQSGLATARKLLWSDAPSEGFITLWSYHRLDLTVEAYVLRPEFKRLFTDADREQARERLTAYGWSGPDAG
jgi:hypothetical protein